MIQPQRQAHKKIAPWALLLVACLWISVIITALAIVSTTQRVRHDVNEKEMLLRQASQLQVEWGQYLLEMSTWGAYSRVEGIASQELNMLAPTSERVVMVPNHD